MLSLAILLCAQEPTVDDLVRKLEGETIEERAQAEAELLRRGRAALKALLDDFQLDVNPRWQARARAALEKLAGARFLDPKRIATSRITYEARGHPLSRAAVDLSERSGLSIAIFGTCDPKLPELTFKETPLDQALDEIMRALGGLWYVEGERILLVAPLGVPLRLYDVNDLTYGHVDEPAYTLEPRGKLHRQDDVEARQHITGADLAERVRTAVGKDRWNEAEGKAIQYQNGLLVVRNEAAVHRRVEKELAALRVQASKPLRLELEVYALKPGEGPSPEKVRTQGRRVAAFERSILDRRRIAVGMAGRTLRVSGYDREGRPVLEDLVTGPRMNARVILHESAPKATLDLEAAFTQILRLDKRETRQGSVHDAEVDHHVYRGRQEIPLGEWVIAGRLAGTRWMKDFPDLVILARAKGGE